MRRRSGSYEGITLRVPDDPEQAYREGQLAGLALKEYDAKRCPCGNRKREQTSFCFHCTQALTADLRAGLYASVKSGYVPAWQAAKAHLVQVGRVKEAA